jgi:hypothetical protein
MSFTRRLERENPAVDAAHPAEALLQLPVRLRGIHLGRPVELVLDLDGRRAIGVEVLCGDGIRRYLPLAAARVRDDEIAVGSSLLLFAETDLAFYRRRARTLGELKGSTVERGGRPIGVLVDVFLSPMGAVVELLVDEGGQKRRVPLDDSVAIAGRGSVTAA